jgi:hypothetical protein
MTGIAENLGVATGFPFGAYEFLVAPDLPHVGAIPVIVGPLYFGDAEILDREGHREADREEGARPDHAEGQQRMQEQHDDPLRL